MTPPLRVFGVTGWKNAGKTGLVERLVAHFDARGISVSTLKHAHHGVDVDRAGTDSDRHRQAGARQVLLSSARRWALMTELRGAPEPPLAALLALLDPVDLVLVEGWKRDAHPKIEAWRAAAGHPLIAPGDPTIRAFAADAPIPAAPPAAGRPGVTAPDVARHGIALPGAGRPVPDPPRAGWPIPDPPLGDLPLLDASVRPLPAFALPVFHLDDTAAIAGFIAREVGL